MSWYGCCCDGGGGGSGCPPCDCTQWSLAISGLTDVYASTFATSFLNATHNYTSWSTTDCSSPPTACSGTIFWSGASVPYNRDLGSGCITQYYSQPIPHSLNVQFVPSGANHVCTITLSIYATFGFNTREETYTWTSAATLMTCSTVISSWTPGTTAPIGGYACGAQSIGTGSASLTLTIS